MKIHFTVHVYAEEKLYDEVLIPHSRNYGIVGKNIIAPLRKINNSNAEWNIDDTLTVEEFYEKIDEYIYSGKNNMPDPYIEGKTTLDFVKECKILKKYILKNGIRYSVRNEEKNLGFYLSRLSVEQNNTINIQILVSSDAGTVYRDHRVKRSSGGTQLKRNSSKKAQLAINKWKTPIQNCMAAETMNGFSVKDVSKKCDEYSLICANANGDTRYVLVIPVAHIGDTIKLSESQYSAAQRIGESYELFVIATEASEAEYIYIKNPYEKVELNRVVKEWEWVCDKYDKEKQIQPVTEVEVVDDYILKNILPDYFNRQQRNFLQDIIMSEDDINYDDKYKISIEQINSISDFYTSRKMIDVINGKIMISMDKKAALKKILGI